MTFSDRIWASIFIGSNLVIGLISVLLGLFAMYIGPTDTIQLKYVFGIFLIFCVVLALFLQVAWEAHNDSIVKPIKVLTIVDTPRAYEKDYDSMLILEPSDLISHDSIVSVYHIDKSRNDLEKFVGLGQVINVQNDKKIQVVVRKNENSEKSITDIQSKAISELEFVLVKPSVPYQLLSVGNYE